MHGGFEDVQDVLVERVGLRSRVLVEADARRPLGQRDGERPDVAGQPQRIDGAVAGERALELLAHALGRQLGDARRRRGHQLARARIGLQAVDAAARHAAQDAQRVVAERRRVHGAQHACAQVLATAEGVDPLAVRTSRAIALTVKSRRSRSSRTGSSGSGSMRKSVCGLPV